MNIEYFDIDDFTDLESKEYVDEKIKKLLKYEKLGKYAVILHNDPINGVDYVAKVIKNVFGYGASKAIWLMLKAHFTGKSILWFGSNAEAVKKRDQMILFGPDPNMLHKGAEAIKVTVEKHE